MVRRAWWAVVHGVAKESDTSERLSEHTHSILDLNCNSETPSFNCGICKWSRERFRGTDWTINSGHVLVVEYIRHCKYHVDITVNES